MSSLEQLCKIAKYTVLPRKIGEDRQPEQIMNYFDGAKVCTPGRENRAEARVSEKGPVAKNFLLELVP